jgi:hypothetical protein
MKSVYILREVRNKNGLRVQLVDGDHGVELVLDEFRTWADARRATRNLIVAREERA